MALTVSMITRLCAMTLKIGAGRSAESRREVGEMLFGLIKAHFTDLMENRYRGLFK